MADRDRIPSGIPRNYKGLYKRVCEQQAPEAIAQSALRPLRHYVKSPIHFEAMQAQVKTLQSFFNSETPWRRISERYNDLRQIAFSLAKQEEIEPKIIQDKLLQLYRCHVEEWSHFRDAIRWETQNDESEKYEQLEVVC